METNPNIIHLLEMLDNPDAYSEQEIIDIINRDDETRSTYRLMVAVRQSYAHKAALQMKKDEGRKTSRYVIYKIAAGICAVIITGLAFGAIYLLGQPGVGRETADKVHEAADSGTNQLSVIKERSELQTAPIIFDNAPLQDILGEIATHYGTKVVFMNDKARQLRFHFVWHPQQDLQAIVADLNHFDCLHVVQKDDYLIVE